MVFYNFLRILKNCLFYLTKSFKYLGFSLLLVLVICVCLLLMTNKSNAEVLITNNSTSNTTILPSFPVDSRFNSSHIIIYAGNGIKSSSSTYYTNKLFLYSSTNTGSYQSWLVSYFEGNQNNSGYIQSDPNVDINLWECDLNADTPSWVYKTTFKNSRPSGYNSAYPPFNYTSFLYVSEDVYRTGSKIASASNYSIDLDYSTFTAPALYPNASSSQSEQTALTSGNFTFFIVEPGSISSSQDILLQFYDTTNSDSANNVVQTLTLNENSPFYEESLNSFEYVITARFLPWFKVVNGMSYKARLSWVNPNNSLDTQHIDYNWTMSLTAEQQAIEEQKTQQDINQGINNLNNNINELNNTQSEINNFLNDDSFNSNTVTDSIPNSDNYSVPTYEGFDNIFTAFRNAFTTTETTSVRFVFPNSNGKYIDIPSNLVSSKLPQPLIIIIQAFYWFMICRFILKDISKTAEKTKSGEILDDRDGNIKTDLL